eukprot:COSAG05_NODE_8017_length_745_cov_1.092879_1_plen_143_part_10
MDVEGVRGGAACQHAIKDGHAKVRELLQFGAGGLQELEELFPVSVPTSDYLSNATNRRSFAGCGVANFPAQSNNPRCTAAGCGISQICAIMTDPDAGATPLARLSNLTAQQRAATQNNGTETGCEMDWEMSSPWVSEPGGIPP